MSDRSLLESLGRGAAQGATFGFGDEGTAAILAAMGGPDDGTGIPREYAAGSAEQDYLNSERGDNVSAAAANPVAYGAGAVAGGAPSALAAPAGLGGSAAARIAASGLTGGLLGGLSGAGHADGREIGSEIGKGAALGAGLGTVGGAAIEGLPYARQVLSQLGGPQLATEGAGALGGAQINKAGMLPPRPTTGDMPTELFIPRGGKNLVREEAVSASEDLADASMASNTADAVLGGERASQKAARGEATDAFNKANAGSKPAAPTKAATDMKGTVPPKRGKAAAKRSAETVRAPAGGPETLRAPAPDFPKTPSMHPTVAPGPNARPTAPAPAPQFNPSLRPTMPALAPTKPTFRPESEQAYRDEVLRQMAEGMR